MRHMCLVLFLSVVAAGQSMVEHAAAAAGGSVGGVAGKKVSDGLTKIFNKVDQSTAKAAGTAKTTSPAPSASTDPTMLDVGPGVPRSASVSVPPPPPPAHHAAVRKPAPRPAAVVAPAPEPVLPPPPPPEVTADELRAITLGARRVEVLKLGPPASRITMFDEGHLVEIFRYMSKDLTLGVVRLSDGAVSSVQMP